MPDEPNPSRKTSSAGSPPTAGGGHIVSPSDDTSPKPPAKPTEVGHTVPNSGQPPVPPPNPSVAATPVSRVPGTVPNDGQKPKSSGLMPLPLPGEGRLDSLIGPYRIVAELGRGGMGEVYKAVQIRPYQRDVALKLIRPTQAVDWGLQVDRFKDEIKLLAVMDHPNIAKVYEAGTTPENEPWYAMELVPGVPLIQFCDERQLTIPERLRVFQAICAGVQHAHQKGIIHRDLKPDNILIAVYDGRPVPKIIDFGIARARGVRVINGEIVGTWKYMSPEQAGANNFDIDTRADVYSLGVILCELLTGMTPLQDDQMRQAGVSRIIELIRNEPPQMPDQMVAALDPSSKLVRSRQQSVSELSRTLRGDLNWIVVKALQKDRNRRYDTPVDLSQEIDRHLSHDPVLAAPNKRSYRLKKFVRRHRTAVITGLLTLVMLVGGISLSIWLAIRAMNAESLAEKALKDITDERDQKAEALRMAGISEGKAVTAKVGEEEALKKLLQANTELTKSNEALTQEKQDAIDARDKAKKATAEAEMARGKAEKATQEAEMARRKAEDATKLALSEKQAADLAKDRAIKAKEAEEKAKMSAISEKDLADMARKQAVAARTDAEQREKEARVVADFLGSIFQRSDPRMTKGSGTVSELLTQVGNDLLKDQKLDNLRRGELLATLGRSWLGQGEPKKAIKLLQESRKITTERLSADHATVLLIVQDLARALHDDNRTEEALTLFQETHEKQSKLVGTTHPDTLRTRSLWAAAYVSANNLKKANELYLEVIEAQKLKLGEKHPDTLLSMRGRAKVLEAMKQYADAIPIAAAVLGLQRSELGADHPDTLFTVGFLAGLYLENGQVDKSIPLYIQAFEAQKARLGEKHPDTLLSMCDLAVAYQSDNQMDKAIPLYEKSLEFRKEKLGLNNPDTQISISNLAAAWLEMGQPAKAIPLYQQALDLQPEKTREDSERMFMLSTRLATAYRDANQLDKAIPLFEGTLAAQKSKLGEKDPSTLGTMNELAHALHAARKYDQAVAMAEKALTLRKDQTREDYPGLVEAMQTLAAFYQAGDMRPKAEKIYEELLDVALKKHGPNSRETFRTMANVAKAYQGFDDIPEVVRRYEKVLAGQQIHLGKDDQDTLTTMNNLANARANLPEKKGIDAAITMFEEVLQLQKGKIGESHIDRLLTLNNLAAVYQRKGDPKKGIEIYEEAMKLSKKNMTVPDRRILIVLKNLLMAYGTDNQTAGEEVVLTEMLRVVKLLNPTATAEVAASQATLGSLLVKRQKFDEAIPILRECLTTREKLLLQSSPSVVRWQAANARAMLGGAFLGQKNYAEAEPLLKAGFEILQMDEPDEKVFPKAAGVNVVNAADWLFQLYTATNMKDEAEKYRKLRDEYEKKYPKRK